MKNPKLMAGLNDIDRQLSSGRPLRIRQRRVLGWLFSGVCLLTPGGALATAPDRCQADAICRDRVAAAMRIAVQGNFDEALALYEKAYEQSREPRLLLNIGRCYYRLNRPQTALDYYEKFRAEQADLEPELTSRLGQFVAEAKLALLAQRTGSSGTAPTPDPGAGTAASIAEPPPAPLVTPPPAGRGTLFGRPTWRVALGLSAAGLGGVLVGLGVGALSANERCIAPSMTFDSLCASELRPDGQRHALLIDGLSSGIPMVVSGGLLLAGGITLVAWPSRREAGRGELRPAATSAGTTRQGLP